MSNPIVIAADINENSYVSQVFCAIDYESGGYPCWVSNISQAKFFESKADAENMIKTYGDFTRSSTMTDGTIYPPRMLRNVMGTIRIVEIKLNVIFKINTSDLCDILEPMEPIGYLYNKEEV